jgi:NADH-quinone oxidoreductase subunit N
VFEANFDSTWILAILPEILVVVLAAIVMVVDLFLHDERRSSLGWISAVGLGIILVTSVLFARPPEEPTLVWGGMVRFDWLGFVFKLLFLFAAAVTSLLIIDVERIGRRGEFFLLMFASTIGMMFMASAADLIMLYLAIETTSIPLYILAGFLIRDEKSTESGFKYLLFGAMTSAVMLYGFSLLYGFAGTTNLYGLVEGITAGQIPSITLLGSLLLVLVGFAFKISVAPLHFWAPDVYEGAPTPVAGFLSTASKAAGFAVLMRFLLAAFPQFSPYWGLGLAVIATMSMTIGNAIALAQKNIKRLLAYSSIAHAGYALIGVVAATSVGGSAASNIVEGTAAELGITSVVFYLMAYLLTNLAAFGVVTAYGRIACSDDISVYAGMSRRAPWLALAMMVAFLSLSGMPPFGGFVVKVFVFAAAVEANLIWLAVVGVLNSIIGLYYYLTVLKVVYLYRSEEENKPLPVPRSYGLALAVLTIGIVLIGTVIAPWFALSTTAAAAMF